MSRSHQVKSKIWRAHVEAAAKDPKGVKDYCRRNFISPQSLYGWRKKFERAKSSAAAPSSFLPVVVSSREQIHRLEFDQARFLSPHPKWAAEFVRHLFLSGGAL